MPTKKILVVGGAGYIGSHTCLLLAERGYEPVVYDNLSNGHDEFVKWGPLEIGDIRDRERLDEVFRKYDFDAIMHFAALIEVGASVQNPISFYENNVSGSINLLSSALKANINKIVFSSTCATYGLPESDVINEDHYQNPINPYGRTKLIVEQSILDLTINAGFRSVILRYFNAAGADFAGRIGEWHTPETHAIPLAIEVALGRREKFIVFGDDYQTRDGTCIRDYVHVLDLADAHVRALDYLLDGGDTIALNLGTGTGTTVKELLAEIEKVSRNSFPYEIASRRDGDSTILVADNGNAKLILDWEPKYKIEEIVQSAWNWHLKSNSI